LSPKGIGRPCWTRARPTESELREISDDINDDEVVDLIALATPTPHGWPRRFRSEEWQEARDSGA